MLGRCRGCEEPWYIEGDSWTRRSFYSCGLAILGKFEAALCLVRSLALGGICEAEMPTRGYHFIMLDSTSFLPPFA